MYNVHRQNTHFIVVVRMVQMVLLPKKYSYRKQCNADNMHSHDCIHNGISTNLNLCKMRLVWLCLCLCIEPMFEVHIFKIQFMLMQLWLQLITFAYDFYSLPCIFPIYLNGFHIHCAYMCVCSVY